MYVYIPSVEHPVVNIEFVGMCLYVLESYDGRLLHYVSEIAGKCQLAVLSLAQGSLNEQNLSANTCPCKTSYHAGIAVSLIDVSVIWCFS